MDIVTRLSLLRLHRSRFRKNKLQKTQEENLSSHSISLLNFWNRLRHSHLLIRRIISNSYVATNMLQSSIQWDQINDTQNALIWLKGNAPFNSALLAEERFYGWSMINLEPQNGNITIIAYGSNSPPDPALQQALKENAKQIYLIWFTASSIPNFQIVHAEGDIAILRYTT